MEPHRRPGLLLAMLLGLLLTAVLARGERPWRVADVVAVNLVAAGLTVLSGHALIRGLEG